MFAVPWPGTPGKTLCLNLKLPLSRPIRASTPAVSPGLSSATALDTKGAACSAVRQSSGSVAPAHVSDVGIMALIAATMSTPLPVPVVPAPGAAAVAVAACLTARGEAVASPLRRRAEKVCARIAVSSR